jgi:hypothetical protein
VADAWGQLIIKRPEGSRRDRLRGYSIFVDGHQIGKVRAGGQVDASVAPGAHRVNARIDGLKSRTLEVEIRAGDQVNVIVEPGGGPWQFYQLALPGRYLKISQVGHVESADGS